MADTEYLDNLIIEYFNAWFTVKDTVFILSQEHGIVLSERQVKRLLRKHGVSRKQYSRPRDVIEFIRGQLIHAGQLLGCRIMYFKCLQAGLNVRIEDVRMVLRILHPVGVELRRTRRLQRRKYFAIGPNFIWHIDGYDKLKPFGLCIHGCICGFSRQIIWLNVYNTNNNPKIIGGYFMEAVGECEGCPRLVRGDFGTENVYIRDCQQFLRRHHTDECADRSYIDGANQRIESWCSFLRKADASFWIEHFKSLQERGDFDGDFLDKNLVRFCFMSLIQAELDEVAQVWNAHTIRPSGNQRVPSGRPCQMYHVPSLWGAEDQLCQVPQADIRVCLQGCVFGTPIPCDTDIYQICIEIMKRDHLEPAMHASDATDLYLHLRDEIVNML